MLYLSFQARDYSEALQWYNYSLSFFKAGQMDPNYAKLQRNRASCFLQLKQLEKVRQIEPQQQVGEIKVSSRSRTLQPQYYIIYLMSFMYACQAKEAIKEAERCDPESIFTQFSVYKIAVQENNVEKGTLAVR